jgi:secondary thiamine-phosphate synthase enzyme
MKCVRKEIDVTTRHSVEIVDITPRVDEIVRSSGIEDGLALVYPMHTSSAVYISDSDRALTADFEKLLAELAPDDREYGHDRSDPKQNATAHLKAILAGHHVVMPVTAGALDLGTYQTVYYAEFDGCRPKEVLVKVIGE